MNNDKKFSIIGHQNAITYKEIFPLIKENKIWLGYGFKGAAAHFFSPYKDIATAGDHKEHMIRVSGVNWFTNLEIPKRKEVMDLVCKYSPEEYPHYDNYDAIEVSKTANIPCDYEGIMGVPITFLDKYNPEQFEIIGITENNISLQPYWTGNTQKYDRPYLKGKRMYSRILIRNKHPQKP